MKKYGILTIERDETPGCRSTDKYEKWFESETARDEHYDFLTRPRKMTMDDLLCGDGYTEYSYTKIEGDINSGS